MKNKGRFFKVIIALFFLLGTSSSIAVDNCGQVSLNEAKKKYETGNFDEVFKIINYCLEEGFNDEEKVQAYRILALTYIAVDSLDNAYSCATNLLAINPDFDPDLFDSPAFVEMVNKIKDKGSVTLITSVSKKAENILEAPANVMIITQEDIKERGYIDLEQLFNDLPGFDVSRTFGPTYSNIYQRGYGSVHTERTLFLVDGVEENDLLSNVIFLSRQFPITNVKRVEVVYGPASTMYGANALVGVVNVITKDPDELAQNGNFGVRANMGYGTYNTYYGDITLSAKTKNVAFSITARRFVSDEMDLSEYEEFDYDPSYYDGINYKDILTVTDGANDFVREMGIGEDDELYDIIRNTEGDTIAAQLTDYGAEVARQRDKDVLNDTVNGEPVGYSNLSEHWLLYGKLKMGDFDLGYQTWTYRQNGTNYYNDNNEAGADNGSIWVPKQNMFYVKYNKPLSDNLLFMNFAQYRTSEVDDDSRSVILANISNGLIYPERFYQNIGPLWLTEYYYSISRQFRNESKIHYIPNSDFDLVAGLEIRNSQIQGDYRTTGSDSASAIEIGTSSGDALLGGNDYTIYDMGFYAQGTYKFYDWVNLTLGGRYDYNKIRVDGGYGSEFNPRVALVLTPSNFIFKGIYASAFQNASNWTKFSTNTSRALTNPTLGPEQVKNWEFYTGWKASENLFADILYYKSYYDGVVGTAVVPYNGGTTEQRQAIGEMKIQGLQATVNYKYRNYKFYAHYTYTDPQNAILEDGKLTGEYQRIAEIAEHKFNVGANALFFDHLNLNLRMNYSGERPVGPGTSKPANPGNFPSILLLNGAISLTDIIPGASLQFIVNNITDLEYFDPGVRSADGVLYSYRTPQRRRNWILRLMYDF